MKQKIEKRMEVHLKGILQFLMGVIYLELVIICGYIIHYGKTVVPGSGSDQVLLSITNPYLTAVLIVSISLFSFFANWKSEGRTQ